MLHVCSCYLFTCLSQCSCCYSYSQIEVKVFYSNSSMIFLPLTFLLTTQYIKDFYNQTVLSRNGTGLSEETLTLMYSLTVSVFAIGGLLGSLIVGMLVTRFGR